MVNYIVCVFFLCVDTVIHRLSTDIQYNKHIMEYVYTEVQVFSFVAGACAFIAQQSNF